MIVDGAIAAKIAASMGVLLLSIATSSADSVKPRVAGPFPEGMDTWLPSTSNGSAVHDSTLRVGTLTGVADVALVRFDLSGLPQRANVAYLWLYASPYAGTTPAAMNWYRITSPWHSGTVKWATQPSSIALVQTIPPKAPGWYRLDITTTYNQWRSGSASSLNFGLRIGGTLATNNLFNMFSSSSAQGNRPQLDVYYTPQANDSILKLKWPLATPYATRFPTQKFKDDWSANKYCNGLIEKHNGTDFRAAPGTGVFSAEDGVVKEILLPSETEGWAYNIVLEHQHPLNGKYTTVYWHVTPVPDLLSNRGFVPKGMQIATVANLSPPHASHFHFGVRIGEYVQHLSGTGALPQTVCGGHQAFPAGFIDPNNTNNVIFQ
ncbi:MAG: Peptidase family [Methylobacteriaceae bacterium]|nr:Peptidase family [Methylobacteriaceae bacterium]